MTKLSSRPKADGMQPEIWTVASELFEALDCPRSLTAYMLCKYGEFDQVARLRANPSHYVAAAHYYKAAQASDFLRKWPDLPVKVDRAALTEEAWRKSEAECGDLNWRFTYDFTQGSVSNSSELLVDIAAEFIRDTLGPIPRDLTPRFGPGATVSDPARRTTVLDKVSSTVTFTAEAAVFFTLWENTAWGRAHLRRDGYYRKETPFRAVEGNCYFTVPKTATIDRACAKGPSLNLGYQLAVGQEMRARLKRNLALDLGQRQAHHANLARIGSVTGGYATIDSERASDTMAYKLVERLFCYSPLWFELIRSLREPKTLINGEWVELEKFSAMGNGFTFELETLVFLSLAYAVAWGAVGHDKAMKLVRQGHICAYGDDLIVPSKLGRRLIDLMKFCGFTPNLQKSYLNGEFRESCGGDYFKGFCVNTAKVTDSVDQPADWFSLHNLLKERVYDAWGIEGNYLRAVKDQLPRGLRSMYGPKWLGDKVLHGQWSVRATKYRRCETADGRIDDKNQVIGTIKVLTPVLSKADIAKYAAPCQLAYGLYTGSFEEPTRRPTKTLRYTVAQYEEDIHVLLKDMPPKPPVWLANSPYSRFFGIEGGAYVT